MISQALDCHATISSCLAMTGEGGWDYSNAFTHNDIFGISDGERSFRCNNDAIPS
jgi:hypothetical protein